MNKCITCSCRPFNTPECQDTIELNGCDGEPKLDVLEHLRWVIARERKLATSLEDLNRFKKADELEDRINDIIADGTTNEDISDKLFVVVNERIQEPTEQLTPKSARMLLAIIDEVDKD